MLPGWASRSTAGVRGLVGCLGGRTDLLTRGGGRGRSGSGRTGDASLSDRAERAVL